MISWTLAEIAEIVGGRVQDAEPTTVVSRPAVADSRAVEAGGLFVADGRGHDFAAEAIERGASAVLASRPLPGLPCVIAPPAPEHAVDASVVAIGRLVRELIRRLPECTVVGITGSAGKTSTKDLLAQVLSRLGPTVVPDGNLNDELGMPLTASRADERTRFLVLEMGARHVGHIEYLAGIAAPRVGVVTNVGLSHVGEFGDQDAIARAKGELVAALPADGVAVLNADDRRVAAMAERTSARVVGYAVERAADVRAEDVELDELARPGFRLRVGDRAADVRLQLSGEHQVSNALAVAAVALEAGMDLDAVAAALSEAAAHARWRMELSDRADGVRIVNDAYNASPDAMFAALAAMRRLAEGRRSWAVLGAMRELGEASRSAHEDVGRCVVECGIDRLLVVGEGARPILDGASTAAEESGGGPETSYVADTDEALALLRRELRSGDVVLFKSARDSGLRYLGDTVAADDARSGADTSIGDPAGAPAKGDQA